MTRKDFLLLSSAIKKAGDRIAVDQSIDNPTCTQQLRGLRRTAAHIADAIFAEQGSRFDVARFLKDCGFTSTETGATMHRHMEEERNANARR